MIAEERRRRELERRRRKRLRNKRYPVTTTPLDTQDSFFKYIKGKRVIIVGPAGYLQGQKKGQWIDSHDVVIRMNLAVPVEYPEDYGSKTDVLYTFATRLWAEHWVDCTRLKEAGLRWVVITTGKEPYVQRFRNALDCTISMMFMSQTLYEQITKECFCTPNTGATAITHILRGEPALLTVVGCDYYASGYYNGYGGDGAVGNHIFVNQLAYLKMLRMTKENLIYDTALHRAIRSIQICDNSIYADSNVSIIIPYRGGEYWRDRIFAWLLERYKLLFPNTEICIGTPEGDKFNRSAAINDGVRKATRELICITDADALFGGQLLYDAVQESREGYCKLKNVVFDITQESTDLLLSNNYDYSQSLDIRSIRPANFFCVISKEQFNAIGGFDENFNGWGGEDSAFYKTLDIYFGTPRFITGRIFHLWHPSAPGKENYRNSESYVLWRKYKHATKIEHIKKIRETRT